MKIWDDRNSNSMDSATSHDFLRLPDVAWVSCPPTSECFLLCYFLRWCTCRSQQKRRDLSAHHRRSPMVHAVHAHVKTATFCMVIKLMWGKFLHGPPRMLTHDLFAVANLLVMRPSSLGGAAYCVALCLSVCLSVCPSVPLSLPSVTSRHLANYNDTHVLLGTRWGPHIVRPSRPHKFLLIMQMLQLNWQMTNV